MGPTEERGFAVWVGYDIAGVDDDLTPLGLTKIDDWLPEQIAAHGIKTFAHIAPDDHAALTALGIRRRDDEDR